MKERASTEPFTWWKMNGYRYATIEKLAKDAFATQSSSVVSGHVFSIYGRLTNATHSRLSDESITAVMLLQSGQ